MGEIDSGSELTTLAILKARLAAMSPAYRWYPVSQRYIQIVSGRVNGSGGNAASIPPSLLGYPAVPAHRRHHGHEHQHEHEHEHCYSGKIGALIFDRFGDFEGFLLDTEDGEHRFYSREGEMKELVQRAWIERLRVTVRTRHGERHDPQTVILKLAPG